MSTYSFVKTAGEDLFEEDEINTSEAKAAAIKQYVRQLDLRLDHFEVTISGDTAVIRGEAITNDSREKAILAAGNIAGIAEVDEAIEVRVQSKVSDFYTVKKGDSLSRIAKEFYGDDYQYNKIFTANQPMLHDPDDIYPGMVIRIPKAD